MQRSTRGMLQIDLFSLMVMCSVIGMMRKGTTFLRKVTTVACEKVHD